MYNRLLSALMKHDILTNVQQWTNLLRLPVTRL
jgi:hypothetical protein